MADSESDYEIPGSESNEDEVTRKSQNSSTRKKKKINEFGTRFQ